MGKIIPRRIPGKGIAKEFSSRVGAHYDDVQKIIECSKMQELWLDPRIGKTRKDELETQWDLFGCKILAGRYVDRGGGVEIGSVNFPEIMSDKKEEEKEEEKEEHHKKGKIKHHLAMLQDLARRTPNELDQSKRLTNWTYVKELKQLRNFVVGVASVGQHRVKAEDIMKITEHYGYDTPKDIEEIYHEVQLLMWNKWIDDIRQIEKLKREK